MLATDQRNEIDVKVIISMAKEIFNKKENLFWKMRKRLLRSTTCRVIYCTDAKRGGLWRRGKEE